MNPKPFWSLNHLTFPVAIQPLLSEDVNDGRTRLKGRAESVNQRTRHKKSSAQAFLKRMCISARCRQESQRTIQKHTTLDISQAKKTVVLRNCRARFIRCPIQHLSTILAANA